MISPRRLFVVIIFTLLWSATTFAQLAEKRVETFDGKTLDTAQWTAFRNAMIQQDEALTINAIDDPGSADVTAQSVPIGVGQSVSVEVTVRQAHEKAAGRWVGLVLTDNARGAQARPVEDDRFIALLFRQNSGDFQAWMRCALRDQPGQFGNRQTAFLTHVQPWNATYIYSIERQSPMLAKFTVTDKESGEVLGSTSLNITNFGTVEGDLFISLFSQRVHATFDNVRITSQSKP